MKGKRYGTGRVRRERRELLDAALSIYHTLNQSHKYSGCSPEEAVDTADDMIFYVGQKIAAREALSGEEATEKLPEVQ